MNSVSPYATYPRLGIIVYSLDDINRLKGIVGRKAAVIDAAVATCPAVDQNTRASWGLLYVEVRDWIARTPIADITFTFASVGAEGEGYSTQLDGWATKLRAAPYSCDVPLVEPPPAKGRLIPSRRQRRCSPAQRSWG
jgi:hypothetical protein